MYASLEAYVCFPTCGESVASSQWLASHLCPMWGSLQFPSCMRSHALPYREFPDQVTNPSLHILILNHLLLREIFVLE